jgi:hypothetical protein
MHWMQSTTGLVAGALAVVVAIGAAQDVTAAQEADEKLENGVYVLKFEGPGRKVRLADGYDGFLGKRLSPSVGVGESLQSMTNDNTRFLFTIDKLGPLPPAAAENQSALVVEGLVFHLGRPEKPPGDGIWNTSVNVYSPEATRTLAARYKVEPQLRKHPGHRYEVRWLPGKRQYEVGEAVTLAMELKNTGSGPLRFTFGGKEQGPRDNQFRFIAQSGHGYGKSLPDIGDPENYGGKVMGKVLQPGETFTTKVDLSKWFAFSSADTYKITGIFEMPIIDPASADGFRPLLWDDLAVGECSVRVVALAASRRP